MDDHWKNSHRAQRKSAFPTAPPRPGASQQNVASLDDEETRVFARPPSTPPSKPPRPNVSFAVDDEPTIVTPGPPTPPKPILASRPTPSRRGPPPLPLARAAEQSGPFTFVSTILPPPLVKPTLAPPLPPPLMDAARWSDSSADLEPATTSIAPASLSVPPRSFALKTAMHVAGVGMLVLLGLGALAGFGAAATLGSSRDHHELQVSSVGSQPARAVEISRSGTPVSALRTPIAAAAEPQIVSARTDRTNMPPAHDDEIALPEAPPVAPARETKDAPQPPQPKERKPVPHVATSETPDDNELDLASSVSKQAKAQLDDTL